MTLSILSTFLLWNCALLQTNAAQPPAPQRAIAEIVGQPSIFALRPENVQQRFAQLSSLHASVRTKVLHRYAGNNRGNGISWVVIDFQPSTSDPSHWTLLQVQICWDGSASAETGLRSNLTHKLGHPKGEGDRVYWDLGEHREVSLKNGSFQSPEGGSLVNGILIEAVVLQGEPE
jgi:hypothetical protein